MEPLLCGERLSAKATRFFNKFDLQTVVEWASDSVTGHSLIAAARRAQSGELDDITETLSELNSTVASTSRQFSPAKKKLRNPFRAPELLNIFESDSNLSDRDIAQIFIHSFVHFLSTLQPIANAIRIRESRFHFDHKWLS